MESIIIISLLIALIFHRVIASFLVIKLHLDY